MTLRRMVAVTVLAVVAVLMPAAYASPPDQTWLPGLYDDADHDDAIILITSAVGVIITVLTVHLTSTECVVAILVSPLQLPPLPDSSPYRLRAPPAA